uniref:G_PROTEIN_RECEP_F1_2 domain-containing protein n=1 Tax=Meloidogyne hapla TaxID=6305 RepID=A0A1I8BGY3_MELHA
MLYEQYNNAGPSFALIVPAVLMNIVGVPGIIANLLLICVTIRDKNLRGATNYLLALTAFFEILHQSGHFLFLVISVSGINFINYSTALIFQLHSIFGLTAAQTAMLSTAADRLLCVLFPIKYNNFKIRPYLFVHTILAISSGIWMSINAILFSNKYPTLPVTGYIANLLVFDMAILMQYIILLSKSDNEFKSDIQSRLLKSLIIFVTIVIGGYIFCGTFKLIIELFYKLNKIQVIK